MILLVSSVCMRASMIEMEVILCVIIAVCEVTKFVVFLGVSPCNLFAVGLEIEVAMSKDSYREACDHCDLPT